MNSQVEIYAISIPKSPKYGDKISDTQICDNLSIRIFQSRINISNLKNIHDLVLTLITILIKFIELF